MDITFDFCILGDFYFISGPYIAENLAFAHHHFRNNIGYHRGVFLYSDSLGRNLPTQINSKKTI